MSTDTRATNGKSLSNCFPIFRFDLTHMLPTAWQDYVLGAVARYGRFGCLNGGSVTSRQREFKVTANDIVRVSTGAFMPLEAPWLLQLYAKDILALANRLGIGRYTVADNIRSAVNINMLPPGSQYEWHVDSNPLTGLLFVTDHPAGAGGELIFRPDPLVRPDEYWELTVVPRAGDLLLFDAREAAHSVLPVPGPMSRVSIPMNYYSADVDCRRPEDLDHYLYGGGVADDGRSIQFASGSG